MFTKCVDAALVPFRLQGIHILNYIDDWLILASSESLAARHRDVVLAHMETLGLRLNAKKCVLFPLQRTTYLGVVWDSTTMQARLSPARIESILAAVATVKEGQSLNNSPLQQLLGLMAAASNVIPFGLLYMRPLQWWFRTKGFSPRGNPFHMIKVTRQCLRALDMRRKPWFLSQDLVLGVPCCRVTLSTDVSLTGWGGGGHEWSSRPGSVEWLPSQLAHQLSRDAGRISSSEVLSPRSERSPCVSTHRQHSGGLLHQPPGRSAFAPLVQAGAPDPCVVPVETPLVASSSCPWASEFGSRRPVETGAKARGMDASPRGGEADLESVRSSSSGSLCIERECTMSPLVLSSSSSSPGAGCHGADVAEATSEFWRECAGPSMALGDSRHEGSPLTGGGYYPAPPPGAMEAVGVAPERAQLLASGLSTEVVETILQSRAPSTRKVYALKWKLFTSWCGDHQQDPVNCPVGTVLEFLQARFSTGLTHTTLKVYMAAISAYHTSLGGMSVGKNPRVTRFLCGVLRLRPPAALRAYRGDFGSDFGTIKTALLLALTSLKWVGDLQALSVAPSHLDFAPGMAKSFLYPRVVYIPKVPTTTPQPVMLQAFCPPPFREPDQQKHNCMCPVCALDAYIHRAALWRKSDQLLLCYGPPKRGLPASKQTLSRWIVDAISTAYESSDLPSPLGVKAHSTRAMAAFKALLTGAPIQDICNAAGWSTPLTFVRFYNLDV
ncbi:Retrovirus-related Pol polyprotein from transposon 17.6 [Labeo rohita]|uniref:ribonuclease H n=1 Tax=Labeo rohita TaxID=84645 RepID=A0ABQ8LYI2_LABRO|nr:Retrovirus-related Pol polyprotein from transposon 17.6 [Labeo rohita]